MSDSSDKLDNLITTDNLTDRLIKGHEGFRSKPYKDTEGVLTIGYGFNLSEGFTKEAADILFYYYKDIAIGDAENIFNNFKQLNYVRQAVLVDMAYNLGRSRLKTFVRMIDAVENYEYDHAAIEMLNSRWAGQVGDRADTLSEMMLLGKEI